MITNKHRIFLCVVSFCLVLFASAQSAEDRQKTTAMRRFGGMGVASRSQTTPILSPGAKKLDVLRGTWLITYADTAKNGSITQDSIVTTLSWNKNGDILGGNQELRANGRLEKTPVEFHFDSRTGTYSYSENNNPPSPLIIDGKRWIYPGGNYRTVNTFNSDNTVINYEVQQLMGKQWITEKSGKEIKLH